jgi:hypothetical protein
MEIAATSSAMSRYRSVRSWSVMVTVFFTIQAVLTLIILFSTNVIWDISGKSDYTSLEAIIALGYLLATIISWIVNISGLIFFFIWVHHAHRNLPTLNNSNLTFSPGWAVGWFFIPIFNFYQPYKVLSEIWKASLPNPNQNNELTWESLPRPKMVVLWWIFFFLVYLFATIIQYAWPGVTTAMITHSMAIVRIIVTILMVIRISNYQETKYRELQKVASN